MRDYSFNKRENWLSFSHLLNNDINRINSNNRKKAIINSRMSQTSVSISSWSNKPGPSSLGQMVVVVVVMSVVVGGVGPMPGR